MMVPASTVLQVFAREPVPGAVKTRLAATIGDLRAAAVYRELTLVTMGHALRARTDGVVTAIELWCTPRAESAWFRECAHAAGASLHEQSEGSLGTRMRHALASGLERADRVLLIGTDCPVLDVAMLAAASMELSDRDAVLGPAEDGGFVLVGTRVPLGFEGVRMSTPHAATDTLAAWTRHGIRYAVLPPLWDVDEGTDLVRWERLCAPAGADHADQTRT